MILPLLVVALAVALLTWLLGWWGVIVAALVAGGVLHLRRGAAWLVALAAIVGWGALILLDAVGGRFVALSSSVAGVLRIPPGVLVTVTLLFGALLAWSAAVLGTELGRLARGDRAVS